MRYRLIVLTIIVIAISFFSCMPASADKSFMASAGVIDLANWNPAVKKSIELMGEWKFKWMDDNPDFTLSGFNDAGWPDIMVPGFWNETTKTPFGYGWFRLKIINIPKLENLAIYLRDTHTAYKLYINSKEAIHNGNPAVFRKTTIPVQLPRIARLNGEEEITVALFIANHHHRYGGTDNAPVIGFYHDFKLRIWAMDIGQSIVTGIILMAALYHLFLWLGRKQNRANLYFTFLCFAIATWLFAAHSYLQMIFPEDNVFALRLRIEWISIVLGTISFFLFLRELYPDETPQFMINTVYGTSLLVIPSLILPIWESTHLTVLGQLIISVYAVWVLYIIIKAIIKKRKHAILMFTGISGFIFSLVTTMAATNISALTGLYLLQIPAGFIFLVIVQSTILSFRFIVAIRTAEYLSMDLQKEVNVKTRRIEKQNEQPNHMNDPKPYDFYELSTKIRTPSQKYTAQKDYNIQQIQKMIMDAMQSPATDRVDCIKKDKLRDKWHLTKREIDVVKLLLDGYYYKEISSKLNISINTLKPYISSIYKKCNVNNKIDLYNTLIKQPVSI